MGKGKPSEIWKEIKPRIGDMVTAANDMEQSFDKAVREAYEKGYLDAAHNYHEMCDFLDDEKKEAYQRGLNDAREEKAFCEFCEYEMCSDRVDPCRICARNYMNFFEPKKQEKEEIKVGDEVIRASGKAVVMGVGPVHFEYVYADGSSGFDEVKNVKKTGRHFPEIAEVLQKMKE